MEKQKIIPAFGSKLKALRESAGMTQAQLAKNAGLHLGAVFKIEQGVRNDPSWGTVQALAKALGVDCRAFADCDDMQAAHEKQPARKKGGRTKIK